MLNAFTVSVRNPDKVIITHLANLHHLDTRLDTQTSIGGYLFIPTELHNKWSSSKETKCATCSVLLSLWILVAATCSSGFSQIRNCSLSTHEDCVCVFCKTPQSPAGHITYVGTHLPNNLKSCAIFSEPPLTTPMPGALHQSSPTMKHSRPPLAPPLPQ